MKLHHITFYITIVYYILLDECISEYGATAVTAELLRSRDEEPSQNKTKEGSM